MDRTKIVLVGDPGVGKTSLHHRFQGKRFEERYLRTLGVEFSVMARRDHQFQIWDLAGQEGFSLIRKNYYCGTRLLIFVFQLDDIDTLHSYDKWIEEAKTFSENPFGVVVIGNKLDLVSRRRAEDMAREVRRVIGSEVVYFETSAKTGANVREVVAHLTSSVHLAVGTM